MIPSPNLRDHGGQTSLHSSHPEFQPHSSAGTSDRATLLEREGDHAGLIALLGRENPMEWTPRDAARVALATLRLGEVDRAELLLLQLEGQPQPDPRVALGLSLVAASRSDPRRRMEQAEVGLGQSPDAWTRPYLLCSLGRAWVELQAPERGLEHVQQALTITAPDDLHGRARGLYYLQGVYAALEDYSAQERVAREALRLYELLGVEGDSDCVRLDLAYRRFYQGDRLEAYALLKQVLDPANQGTEARHATALLLRGEFLLLGGHFEAALRDFEAALTLQRALRRDRLIVPLKAYALECRWRMGQLPDAAFYQGVQALRPLSAFDITVVQFYRGLCEWQGGHLELARAAFEQVVVGVALLDSFRVRALAFLLEHTRQCAELTPETLQPLLKALETVGGDAALELDAPALSGLYRSVAAHGWGGQRLTRLNPAAQTPGTLELRTLGGFELNFSGEHLSVRLAKGRELLAYLCLHGPSTRDALLEALWGETGPASRVSYLKQALRALRDTLTLLCRPGEEALTFSEGRYRLNPAWEVRLDLQPLLDLSPTPSSGGLEALREAYREALAAYQGPFLPEVDSSWAESWRLRTHEAALEACLGLAQEASKPTEAAAFYTRATELDPLCEDAWQGLIGVWTHVGDLRQTRRARALCRATFEAELGEPPPFLEERSPAVRG